MSKRQRQRMQTTNPESTSPLDIPKTEFIPHRVDPLLSMSEAGRLVGRSHTTIARWIDSGILEAVRGHGAVGIRIRKSDLIAVTGVAAFARKSPYVYVQEAELPEGYEYDSDSMPAIRTLDTIQYFPVHLSWFKDSDNGQA